MSIGAPDAYHGSRANGTRPAAQPAASRHGAERIASKRRRPLGVTGGRERIHPGAPATATLSAYCMIATYPDLGPVELADRAVLEPLFRALPDGISEFSFPGIFCFREQHGYRLTRVDDTIVLAGLDKGHPFFVAPFGLPPPKLRDQLFARLGEAKLLTQAQAEDLSQAGLVTWEDRDNFDYLYRRDALADLAGRALQRKRNLVNHFLKRHAYRAYPLTPEGVAIALRILERWREGAPDQADYAPAREAITHALEWGLRGSLYDVDGSPAGYALGEYAAGGSTFVVHYEKAIPEMKGLYQVINMDFARSLPASCTTLNREQDLGDPGLRQAKLTYRPMAFLKKFRAKPA